MHQSPMRPQESLVLNAVIKFERPKERNHAWGEGLSNVGTRKELFFQNQDGVPYLAEPARSR
jgi:hypothetical protein